MSRKRNRKRRERRRNRQAEERARDLEPREETKPRVPGQQGFQTRGWGFKVQGSGVRVPVDLDSNPEEQAVKERTLDRMLNSSDVAES